MLLGLSTVASANITGSGCIVSGVAGQTAPLSVAAFTAGCTAAGAGNSFTFAGPANDILNFSQTTGTATPTNFLASNTPTPVVCVGAGCGVVGSTNQQGCGAAGTCLSTWYDFHYVVGTAGTVTFNITHDDGIVLLNSRLGTLINSAGPTSAALSTSGPVTLAVGDVIDLLYDECCSLPATLQGALPNEGTTVVPEPTSIVLLGGVLFGVGAKLRRRLKLS